MRNIRALLTLVITLFLFACSNLSPVARVEHLFSTEIVGQIVREEVVGDTKVVQKAYRDVIFIGASMTVPRLTLFKETRSGEDILILMQEGGGRGKLSEEGLILRRSFQMVT